MLKDQPCCLMPAGGICFLSFNALAILFTSEMQEMGSSRNEVRFEILTLMVQKYQKVKPDPYSFSLLSPL